MKQNSPVNVLRRSFLLFFGIFVITGAAIGGLMMILYRSEMGAHLSQLKTQEEFSLTLQSHAVDNLFDSLVGDLFFLRHQNELQEYLAEGDSSRLDDVANEYLNLSAQKKIYDQVRFLDAQGMELVRINFDQGEPSRIASDKLQSKEKRYYFRDCYELGEGEVFISPFDLNMERGRIEQPFKPMIRLGTPVYDSSGLKRGIVLLNYLGTDLLTKLSDSERVSAGQTMLLNPDGYWLLSPDTSQEWGFMFEDKERSFPHLYPDVWTQVEDKRTGQILTSDGLFTHRTIFPLKEGYTSSSGTAEAFGESRTKIDHWEYHWHLVSFAPKEIIDTFSAPLMMKLFAFGAGMFVIVATGAWFLAFAITKRRIFQDQLQDMALYDALTALPNRRLFNDRLSAITSWSTRYENRFGLLYIDLDGFKNINDSLGHDAGDAVLREVANRLRQYLRQSDVVARLGGDEFVAIVDHLAADDGAQQAAGNIVDRLAEPIALPQGEVQIGASVGISLFPTNSSNGEELLRQADRAMYQSKRRGTNLVTTFSAESATEYE